MAAKLYATVNSAEGPVTLERATPSAPWSPSGEAAADLVRTGPSTFSLVRNGRSHRVLVKEGDTLPLLCHEIYGDAWYGPQVARFNHLADFRRLVPGTQLHFPPLE